MAERQNIVVSEEEMAQQRNYIAEVKKMTGGGKYKINTYGCQMNEHDSELLAGMLTEMGYAPTESDEEADVILFNTCCVRDNAERRVSGNIGALAGLKRSRPDLVIGVCGCMMQQEGVAEKLLRLRPIYRLGFRYAQPASSARSCCITPLRSGHRVVEVDQSTAGRIARGICRSGEPTLFRGI